MKNLRQTCPWTGIPWWQTVLWSWVPLVAVAAALFMGPLAVRGRMARAQGLCATYLQMNASAALAYAQDYDGVGLSGAWMDLLQPRLDGSSGTFRCPGVVKEGAEDLYGYAYSTFLVRRNYADVENQQSQALIFDSMRLDRNAVAKPARVAVPARHGLFNQTVYMDCHVAGARVPPAARRPFP